MFVHRLRHIMEILGIVALCRDKRGQFLHSNNFIAPFLLCGGGEVIILIHKFHHTVKIL